MKQLTIWLLTLALCLCAGCSKPVETPPDQPEPPQSQQPVEPTPPDEPIVPPQEPVPAPPAEEKARGTTEVFEMEGLLLEVTHVRDIRTVEQPLPDGTQSTCSQYVCWPEGEITVLAAGEDAWLLAGESDSQTALEWLEPQSVADVQTLVHEKSSQVWLRFAVEDTPVPESALEHDVNGDGLLQVWEFPVASGETFGLTGQDAALYAAAARLKAREVLPRTSGEDTMLMIPTLTVYGSYEGENGALHYVCGRGARYYYDLGGGLADLARTYYSSQGSEGHISRLTLDADGRLVEVQDTWDGADNTQRIRELCGPLSDLADQLNAGTTQGRALTPGGDDLLKQYLAAHFGAEDPIPVEENALLAAFRAVLRGESTYQDDGSAIGLDNLWEAITTDSARKVTICRFAVLDLDGDAIPEAVLQLDVDGNEQAGFVALRWTSGGLRGYTRYYRAFEQLKADGTFLHSSSADNTGIGRLVFTDAGAEIVSLAHAGLTADGSSLEYFIEGKPARQIDFEHLLAAHDDKPDAPWQDFTAENIDNLAN